MNVPIADLIESQSLLVEAITRQTEAISQLANAVGALVESGVEDDDQTDDLDPSQGLLLMDGTRIS